MSTPDSIELDAHPGRVIHPNSRRSYLDGLPESNRRERQILAFLRERDGYAFTDREICYSLGYGEDLNKVRPRINRLIGSGLIREAQSVTCDVTGRTVRTVTAVLPD